MIFKISELNISFLISIFLKITPNLPHFIFQFQSFIIGSVYKALEYLYLTLRVS